MAWTKGPGFETTWGYEADFRIIFGKQYGREDGPNIDAGLNFGIQKSYEYKVVGGTAKDQADNGSGLQE